MRKLLSALLKIMEFITDYKAEIIMFITFVPVIVGFCYLAFTVSVKVGIGMVVGFLLVGVFLYSENIAIFLREKGVE